jgi:GH25 family lysozyme M1 (1,4-beta-N-acetylmuramidase)
MKLGIDVSEYQGEIDWHTAKRADPANNKLELAFAFIRMSLGLKHDKRGDFNWQAARDAGVARGAYMAFDPTIDAGGQAATMLEALKGEFGELPLAIDVELPLQIWNEGWGSNLRRLADRLQQASGRKPIIYTGKWYWDDYVRTCAQWVADYPLWEAYYTLDPDKRPAVPAPWRDYSIHQYSNVGIGKLYGASSDHIDLDAFYHDEVFQALTAPATANPEPSPAPEGSMSIAKVPWVSQVGAGAKYANDCGPACWAMLAKRWGIDRSVEALAEMLGVQNQYTSTWQAVACWEKLGLKIAYGAKVLEPPFLCLVHYLDLPERYDRSYKKDHWIVVVGTVKDAGGYVTEVVYHDPLWPTEAQGAYKHIGVDQFHKAEANVAARATCWQ